MKISPNTSLWPKVSLLSIWKPHGFRSPGYTWDWKKVSDRNILKLSETIWRKIIIWNQNHWANVRVINVSNVWESHHCDALLTQQRDIALFVLASDCVPIILHDTKLDIIWVIHAGRKWLELWIIPRTIDSLVYHFHSNPQYIQIEIWACISQNNYELWKQEIEFFSQDYKEFINKGLTNTSYYLDIRSIAQKQLIESWILEKHISVSWECTYENNNMLHSYRRHTQTPEKCYANNAFGIWFNN